MPLQDHRTRNSCKLSCHYIEMALQDHRTRNSCKRQNQTKGAELVLLTHICVELADETGEITVLEEPRELRLGEDVRVPYDETVAGVAPGDDGVRRRVLHQVERLGQERRRAHLVQPLHRPRRVPAATDVLVLQQLLLHNAWRHRVHGAAPKNPAHWGTKIRPSPNRTPKNSNRSDKWRNLTDISPFSGGVSQRKPRNGGDICAR
jgi:hypothetical protein